MKSGASITFIGAGNVACHLAPALDNTDYAVREVYSRNKKNAKDLVSKLYEADVVEDLDFSKSRSKIFILAVPDDAIEEIANEMVLPDQAILVHTSGSRPLSILGYAPTPNIGVVYPLQTFTKGKKIDLSSVPIFVEAENREIEKILVSMARSLSKNVHVLSSDKRMMLHLSAVFASNFTNHMLTVAEDIMKDNKLDYEWLKPLVVETMNKSLSLGPSAAQTGPARRGDVEILDKHIAALKKNKALKEIYQLISQHILDKYQS